MVLTSAQRIRVCFAGAEDFGVAFLVLQAFSRFLAAFFQRKIFDKLWVWWTDMMLLSFQGYVLMIFPGPRTLFHGFKTFKDRTPNKCIF